MDSINKMTKTPDLEEESKKVKKNIGFLRKVIIDNPKAVLIILLILALIIFFFFLFTIKNIPFTDYKIGLESSTVMPPKCEELRIEESVFSLHNGGKDWEINKAYTFGFVVTSKQDFYGHVILYLRPNEESGLKTPIVLIDRSDIMLKVNDTEEIKGNISTKNVDKGRYNICVLIKDNDIQSGYTYEFCDGRQININ